MSNSEHPDLIVVGGGPCGLSTAFFARNAGLKVKLIDAGERAGGRMRTRQLPIPGADRPLVLETGASGWVGSAPALEESAAALKLTPIESAVADSHRYLIHRGQPVALPQNPGGLLRTPVLTTKEKVRAAAEPWADFCADDREETASEFFTRRFGPGFTQKVVGPIIAGVFAADPDTLSMPVAFPALVAAEQEYGSLVKALKRNRHLFGTPMHSFAGGMSEWADAITQRLGADFVPNEAVDAVLWEAGWWFVYRQGHVLASARQLAIALPVHQTAYVLRQFLRDGEHGLDRFRGNGLASVAMLFRRDQVEDACSGFGILAPLDETSRVASVQFSHAIFPQHVPTDHLLLRFLLGGERHPGTLEATDEDLTDAAFERAQQWLGARDRPLQHWVHRHPGGVAHRGLGHMAAVAEVAEQLNGLNGLHLGGDAFTGSGIVPAVERGREIALAAAATRSGDRGLVVDQ